MTYFVLGAVAVGLGVVAAVGAWQRRRERARLLARLRREWAKPRPSHREEPAGYYHGLMHGNGGSLDATTWLTRVFTASTSKAATH